MAIANGAPVVVAGVGTYVFFTNGNWTFDPVVNPSTSSQTGNFSYRITDGDGDISEATQAVNITNVNLPLAITGSITNVVEEEHLNSAQAVGK